jgi:hypothetical protein
MTTVKTFENASTMAALAEASEFPLFAALSGRRARRFAMGDVIPTAPSPSSAASSRCLSPMSNGCPLARQRV